MILIIFYIILLKFFLPVTFEPTFKFIGYQGMASHGAAIAIILSVYLYANYAIWLKLFPFQFQFKKQKRDGQSFLWVADRIVIVVALAGCFIRLGNFTNSEIIGKPTHSHMVSYLVMILYKVLKKDQQVSIMYAF